MLALPPDSTAHARPARWLIGAGAAACVAGLVVHGVWRELPLLRFAESVVLAGLVGALAWVWRRLRGGTAAQAWALVWLALLVVFCGVAPVLAVAVLALAVLAVGTVLAGTQRPLLALLTGLALLAGVGGWLLPLPIHRPAVYLPLFGAIVLLRRNALRELARHALAEWRAAVDTAPVAAHGALVLLGLASAGAWLPTMQYDDLAYHLGLPWQLMLHGRYALDPANQVWALAPWASDVLHGIAQVIARAEARGPLNALWLLATAAGLWRLGEQLGLAPAIRWALLALYASLPPVVALLAGMQTETAATAAFVALATVVFAGQAGARESLVAGTLFGLLVALKPLHALAAMPLLLVGLWRWRAALAAAPLAGLGALTLVLLLGGSSYATAWRVAGNPVLPLFNATFRSPYFAPVDFADARWQRGFDADLPWDLTFDTAHYLEAWNGGFGFALVALAGAWLLALADARTRTLGLCATLAMLLPLAALQYARYAVPGLVLLLPALLLVLQRWLPPRSALAAIAALCVLNLMYQANAHWMLRNGAIRRTVVALGDHTRLLARHTPERVIAAAIRTRAPDARVLDFSGAAHAEFAGRGRTAAWYAPRWERIARDADHDRSGRIWAQWLQRERIGEVLLRPATLPPARRAALERLHARPVMTVDEAQWWRIPGAPR